MSYEATDHGPVDLAGEKITAMAKELGIEVNADQLRLFSILLVAIEQDQ